MKPENFISIYSVQFHKLTPQEKWWINKGFIPGSKLNEF